MSIKNTDRGGISTIGRKKDNMAEQQITEDIKIVVVDDDTVLRDVFCEHLRVLTPYTILDAPNGQKALEIVRNQDVALVISDIQMPGMKGYELLGEVKKINPQIKRMLITAYSVDEYIRCALEHDVGTIYSKSALFSHEEFAQDIKKIITGDIFGLEHYFSDISAGQHFFVTASSQIDHVCQKICDTYPDVNRRSKLNIILHEIIVNAFVYGGSGWSNRNRKAFDWNKVLREQQAVSVQYQYDDTKFAVSVCDNAGLLRKEDCLKSIYRQVTTDEHGLPIGLLDEHGRGIFLTRRYIDKVQVNVDPGKKTEVLLINYFHTPPVDNKPILVNQL